MFEFKVYEHLLLDQTNPENQYSTRINSLKLKDWLNLVPELACYLDRIDPH